MLLEKTLEGGGIDVDIGRFIQHVRQCLELGEIPCV